MTDEEKLYYLQFLAEFLFLYVSAKVFGGANFAFSMPTGHGAEGRKRHDLETERLQRAGDA